VAAAGEHEFRDEEDEEDPEDEHGDVEDEVVEDEDVLNGGIAPCWGFEAVRRPLEILVGEPAWVTGGKEVDEDLFEPVPIQYATHILLWLLGRRRSVPRSLQLYRSPV